MNNTKDSPSEMSQVAAAYLNSFTPKERKAYEIASSHLQTSFDLIKSIGFKKFEKKYLEENR